MKTERQLKESQKEIVRLSKLYVRDLAEAHGNVNDGPAAFPDTGYGERIALLNNVLFYGRLQLTCGVQDWAK